MHRRKQNWQLFRVPFPGNIRLWFIDSATVLELLIMQRSGSSQLSAGLQTLSGALSKGHEDVTLVLIMR